MMHGILNSNEALDSNPEVHIDYKAKNLFVLFETLNGVY